MRDWPIKRKRNGITFTLTLGAWCVGTKGKLVFQLHGSTLAIPMHHIIQIPQCRFSWRGKRCEPNCHGRKLTFMHTARMAMATNAYKQYHKPTTQIWDHFQCDSIAFFSRTYYWDLILSIQLRKPKKTRKSKLQSNQSPVRQVSAKDLQQKKLLRVRKNPGAPTGSWELASKPFQKHMYVKLNWRSDQVSVENNQSLNHYINPTPERKHDVIYPKVRP